MPGVAGNRTSDPLITSPTPNQLSYCVPIFVVVIVVVIVVGVAVFVFAVVLLVCDLCFVIVVGVVVDCLFSIVIEDWGINHTLSPTTHG